MTCRKFSALTSQIVLHHKVCRHFRRGRSSWDEYFTLRSWALLERPPVVQPLEQNSAFYGSRRFITAFTRALHWSLFWARPIQATPPNPISPRTISILSIHLRLGLPSDIFPSGFPTNNLHARFSSLHECYMHRPPHLSWLDHSNYIRQKAQITKLLVTVSFALTVLCILVFTFLSNSVWIEWQQALPEFKHILISTWTNFDTLLSFPNISTVTQFQTICLLFLCPDFELHPVSRLQHTLGFHCVYL
jgi:hypothetical protein